MNNDNDDDCASHAGRISEADDHNPSAPVKVQTFPPTPCKVLPQGWSLDDVWLAVGSTCRPSTPLLVQTPSSRPCHLED